MGTTGALVTLLRFYEREKMAAMRRAEEKVE